MKRIRELAGAGKYRWRKHVSKRFRQRDIDIFDVKDVLRLGEIKGPIRPGNEPGEWKCKVTGSVDTSSRQLGVVLVVIRNDELFFVTVEWEDVK